MECLLQLGSKSRPIGARKVFYKCYLEFNNATLDVDVDVVDVDDAEPGVVNVVSRVRIGAANVVTGVVVVAAAALQQTKLVILQTSPVIANGIVSRSRVRDDHF